MKNSYEIRGEVTAIFLKRKDGSILETLIDTVGLQNILSYPIRWFAEWNKRTKSYYAIGSLNGKTVRLHRIIMMPKNDELVDHRNHDTLCNLRFNLRKVTNAENMQNMKHRVDKGVDYHKASKKWRVRQMCNGVSTTYGVFDSYEEAVKCNRIVKGSPL